MQEATNGAGTGERKTSSRRVSSIVHRLPDVTQGIDGEVNMVLEVYVPRCPLDRFVEHIAIWVGEPLPVSLGASAGLTWPSWRSVCSNGNRPGTCSSMPGISWYRSRQWGRCWEGGGRGVPSFVRPSSPLQSRLHYPLAFAGRRSYSMTLHFNRPQQ